MALADPTLGAGDLFALKVNWGQYEGHHAFGAAATALLSKNAFGSGEKLAIGGGVSVSSDGNVGTRVGMQLSW